VASSKTRRNRKPDHLSRQRGKHRQCGIRERIQAMTRKAGRCSRVARPAGHSEQKFAKDAVASMQAAINLHCGCVSVLLEDLASSQPCLPGPACWTSYAPTARSCARVRGCRPCWSGGQRPARRRRRTDLPALQHGEYGTRRKTKTSARRELERAAQGRRGSSLAVPQDKHQRGQMWYEQLDRFSRYQF